jgi:putative heme transporter
MQAATPIDTRIDFGQLARRARVPAAIAAGVVVAAVVLGGPARHLLDALERAFTADPRWVLAAAGFEALSFAGYIALLSHVAGRGNDRFGFKQSYRTTLAGAAATRLLPTAGAGGAALTLWVLRRSGHDGRAGMRTLLTFLVLLYAVFLGAILVAGGLTAAGVTGGGTLALSAIPAALAAVAIAIPIGLAVRAPRGDHRLARGGALLGEAVRDAITLVRHPDPRLLGAFAWWGFDVLVLWSVFHAVGSPPPFGVLVLGYFLGQVANTIPIPGAASGGLAGVLLAFGVAPDLALAGVLAYRSIAIWLPAPFGAHALAGLRRDAARWTDEDAPRPARMRVLVHAPQPLAA